MVRFAQRCNTLTTERGISDLRCRLLPLTGRS
jgi:hypothetical protein